MMRTILDIAEFGFEAVKWLIKHRSIVGIGTECPDIELYQGGKVKLLLASESAFSVVQLTNLIDLPMRGLKVTLAPLKLQKGSGGPTRVFAQVDKHRHRHNKDNLCPKIKGDPQAFASNSNNLALSHILAILAIFCALK